MKIGTKMVQKRSEMFGPVGFPRGNGLAALPQQATRNQNWSKTSPVSGGGGFVIRRERSLPLVTARRHRRFGFDASAVRSPLY